MIKKIFSAIGLTLTLMLFSFLAVMGGEEKPPQPSPEPPLEAAGLFSSQDLSALSAHFGAAVPVLSVNGAGRVEDIPFGDGYARKLTWTDENNLTTICIRPAAAANLLRDDALSPSGEYCTIDGMTAIILRGSALCQLHFGNENAAYCLSYNGNADNLLSQLQSLQFIQK